ncbi:MAG: DUF2225 domain-containing protein [Veillonellales bacterium]
MTNALYAVEKTCSICGESFMVTKVRSRLVKMKQDTDFCCYYKGINPYYYTVWVCPHCGYAAQDTMFDRLSAGAAAKIKNFLASRKVNLNLGGTRTREQAVDAYKLAIFYEELIEAAASKIGGLYLRLAWVYREGQQGEEEQLALKKAVEFYDQALSRERLPIGVMSEITLTFLVGELYRRTGAVDKSLQYFSKVVSSPQAKLERRILTMAREAWQQAREERRQTAGDAEE